MLITTINDVSFLVSISAFRIKISRKSSNLWPILKPKRNLSSPSQGRRRKSEGSSRGQSRRKSMLRMSHVLIKPISSSRSCGSRLYDLVKPSKMLAKSGFNHKILIKLKSIKYQTRIQYLDQNNWIQSKNGQSKRKLTSKSIEKVQERSIIHQSKHQDVMKSVFSLLWKIDITTLKTSQEKVC